MITTTPKTDAMSFTDAAGGEVVDASLARTLERELSTATAQLAERDATIERMGGDAERYKKIAARYLFLRDEEYPEGLLLSLREAHVHKSVIDDNIDTAITALSAPSDGQKGVGDG